MGELTCITRHTVVAVSRQVFEGASLSLRLGRVKCAFFGVDDEEDVGRGVLSSHRLGRHSPLPRY